MATGACSPGPARCSRANGSRPRLQYSTSAALAGAGGRLGLKVLVGGSLNVATLERGSFTHRRVHDFADDAETLGKIFAGNRAPDRPGEPCPCGSGKTSAACHLADELDRPCYCGQGKAFGECCSIAPATAPVPAA